MAKQTYTIQETGQQVQIESGWFGRNVVVSLDGREVGRFANQRDLKGGATLKTPIGDLILEYRQAFAGSGYDVWHGKTLLAGSVSDPVRRWRNGYQTAFFLGIFNTLLGLVGMLSDIELLQFLGIGTYSLVFGLALLALGVWAWKGRSAAALWLAAIIFGGDGLLGFLLLMSAGGSPNIGFVIIRVLFVILLVQGAQAAPDVVLPAEKVKNSA